MGLQVDIRKYTSLFKYLSVLNYWLETINS